MDFEVRAKRPPEPKADENGWLVYCERCAWHCETGEGICWKGCPECGEPLWLTPPDGRVFRLPAGPVKHMRADSYDKHFRARRRKNAWRTAPLSRGEEPTWTPA